MAHSARFNNDWLLKEQYKSWLIPVSEDNTKAKCKLCSKVFSLLNMGEIAIKSHASGKKHIAAVKLTEKVESVSDFFGESSDSQKPTSSQQHDTISTPRLSDSVSSFVLRKDQHKAEILWALKTVMSHYSYNSANNIADLFRAMFPDSKIAEKMQCGPTKLSYLICFGIAPYFKQQLLSELKETQCFVISFDESLSSELHQEQMDFVVKYFSNDKVVCKYLTSGFLGHTRACDLKQKFEECIQDLDQKKLVQVSMDGPSVNWKLYESLVEERKENKDYPSLINVGSCSLHIMHGAFRTGVKKTKWGIDTTLKALHNLFEDSPAKREDYQEITGSDIFPLPFCGHRWLEDKKVASRALDIWPNIVNYVKDMLKKPTSQIPSSSYFSTVRSAVQDSLMVAKLQFFVSTSSIFIPYLQKFQADAPLIPFMTNEVSIVLEALMQKFVKKDNLKSADSPAKIAKLNVMETSIHLDPSDIDVGFAAAATLEKAVKEKKISKREHFEFKKECSTMLATMVTKLQERSAIQYSFAGKLASLDPWLVISESEKVQKMFKEVLKKLVEAKWMKSEQADCIWMQYKKFVSDAKQFHHDEFSSFLLEENRLDTFYFKLLSGKRDFKELWDTMKFLLTLSHGQASVERGFSVNKEVLAPNLREVSLVAQRFIHDTISTQDIQLSDFTITEELLQSCNHANSRYKMYLIDEEEKAKQPEKIRKRKALQEELDSAKKRKKDWEITAQKLVSEADMRAKEAAEKSDAAVMKAILIESNGARDKSQDIKKTEIPKEESKIKDIEKKLKLLD